MSQNGLYVFYLKQVSAHSRVEVFVFAAGRTDESYRVYGSHHFGKKERLSVFSRPGFVVLFGLSLFS